MRMTKPLNVLFLCTHNSARSIVAECIINRLGASRFKGYSAGSQPSDRVHPYALDILKQLNYSTTNCARSPGKSMQLRAHLRWTSSSRSATAPQTKCALFGRDSP
jgi:protein-tyrosine-phosphatase